MKRTTREELLAWKARWELVNQFEIDELRRTPIAKKYEQFIAGMQMAIWFDWRQREVDEVRQRWRQIREYYLGQSTPAVAGKAKKRSA